MTDKAFSNEGMPTAKNRDDLAREISRAITAREEARPRAASAEAHLMLKPTLKQRYDQLIYTLQGLAVEAYRQGDRDWFSDCVTVIKHVVPLHSGESEELQRLLIRVVQDIWKRLEKENEPSLGIVGNIGRIAGNILGRIGRACGLGGRGNSLR
jgi:hypothetical protein